MHKQMDLTKIKCVEPDCGMQFQEQKSLVSHQEKIHSGPKVIKCEICFKELTFLEGIPHRKQHADEETHGYMCLIDDCGKIKYNQDTLRCHIMVYHKMTKDQREAWFKKQREKDRIKR